jgi:hypothetical protein
LSSSFWQFLIITLAVLVYTAAIVGFGRRAGVSEFIVDLLSWPSVSKWVVAYSVLYFTGAGLLALSIRSRTTKAAPLVQRGFCVCGVLALALGGLALYAVFDSLAFKLQA